MKDKEDLGENPESIETLITYHMSSKNLGPKLYGIFPGGRLEEFIKCHTLTSQEISDPIIRKELAINMARFHAVDLPLPKPGRDQFSDVLRTFKHFKDNKRDDYMNCDILLSEGIDTVKVASFPYEEELTWLQGVVKQIKPRIVFNHWDTNFLNVLVRDEAEEGKLKTCMIDYELAYYEIRGYDLGAHFASRMFCWNDPDNKLNGTPYPSLNERRAFISDYLMEAQKLFTDFDPNGLDSADHLMAEADAGVLIYLLVLSSFTLKFYQMFLTQMSFMVKSLLQCPLKSSLIPFLFFAETSA